MEIEELRNFIGDHKVTNMEFGSHEIKIYFDNNTWVEIGHTVEWDCSAFTFHNSIDEELSKIEYEKRMQEEDQRLSTRRQVEAKELREKIDFVSQLSPELQQNAKRILGL